MQSEQTINVRMNDLNGIHNALEYACAFIKAGRKEMDEIAYQQLLIAYQQCRQYTDGDPDEC